MSLVTLYNSVKQTFGRPSKSVAPRDVPPDERVKQIAFLLLTQEDLTLEPTQHTAHALSIHLAHHTGESTLCEGIEFSRKKPDGKTTFIGLVCKGNPYDIANHYIVRLDRKPDAKFGLFWSIPQCVLLADFMHDIKKKPQKIFDYFDALPSPPTTTAQTSTAQPALT